MHASAPAKLILCGEHAVVYGRPAIAVPLAEIRAMVRVEPGPPGSGTHFHAPDLGRSWTASEQPDDPLVRLALHLPAVPNDLQITIASAIPIASGMGSGAAIATALVRALAAYAGRTLLPAEIAALVYESERHFHGTPSGIDNTVVAFEQAIWFVRGLPIEPLVIAQPLTLVVGDTGLRSATRLPVAAVRERWQADQPAYEHLFNQIGATVSGTRVALALGDLPQLGALFNANQALLVQLGVSAPELDRLVGAAREAGALGAKLSGGGWGGVMFALTTAPQAPIVAEALRAAGAAGVLVTNVFSHSGPLTGGEGGA